MNKLTVAMAATFLVVGIPSLASAQPVSGSVHAGQMLYDSSGHRVGSIYRVTADGSAQVILSGKLVTASASTLSEANGKVTTSLSKSELNKAR